MAYIRTLTRDRRGNPTRWEATFNNRHLSVMEQNRELIVVDKVTNERLTGEELTSFKAFFQYHKNSGHGETSLPVVATTNDAPLPPVVDRVIKTLQVTWRDCTANAHFERVGDDWRIAQVDPGLDWLQEVPVGSIPTALAQRGAAYEWVN